MTARLIIADVFAGLATLEPDSVDLFLSSPPFLAVRSYLPDGHPDKHLEIGGEATPADYLDTLLDVTEACARVLAPHGSLCFEIGDTYSGSGGAGGDGQAKFNGAAKEKRDWPKHPSNPSTRRPPNGWPLDKSLCGIPTLFAWSLAYGRNLLRPERTTEPWRIRTLKAWIRCLDIDTNVYVRTPTGDRPMRMLHLHQQFQPGRFQVWTGEQWTEVTETATTTADDAIELEFRTGERIAATRGHRWPIESILGETKLLRTDELTVGDVVRQVRLPETDRPEPPGLPDDDIGWFVGVFLGDGSFDSKGRIQIAGHQILDAERGERLQRIAADYDGTSSVYVDARGGLGGSVVVRSKPLAAVIHHYIGGDGARNKHLNPAAWRRSDAFLHSLLMGYLESDGHYDAPNDRWRLGFTDNIWLARDLRTIGARLGLSCIVKRWHCGPSDRGGQWAGSATFRHRGEIRFGHKQWWPKARGEIVAIRSTARSRFIDIAVADEPHLFALASGLLTHNTNPPVGALGDKERPATSYIIVATKARDRWFDLDAVRTPHQLPSPFDTTGEDGRPKYARYREGGRLGQQPCDDGTGTTSNASNNPTGAPPLDWWCHVDAILDQELARRAGKGRKPDTEGVTQAHGKAGQAEKGDTSWHTLGKYDGSTATVGATGAHLRRALQTAGILQLEEAIDQSPGGYSGAHYACVDSLTEALTPQGWRHHWELFDGDQIAAYDPATDSWRFESARFLRFPYEGDLIAIDKRTANQRLTPNHRVLYRTRKQPDPQVRFADELTPGCFLPVAAPMLECGSDGPGEKLAALAGWMVTEGHVNHRQVCITQSDKANPAKCEEIRGLLDAAGADYRVKTRDRGRLEFWIRGELAAWLKPYHKHIPWSAVFDWPLDDVQALFDALIDGDGHRRPNDRMSFIQKDRAVLDAVQTIATRLGYRTSIGTHKDSGVGVCYISTGRWIDLRAGYAGEGSALSRVPYKGDVWCPNVPTGFWLARRGGHPFITGNTWPPELVALLLKEMCPRQVCIVCGQPRRRIVETERLFRGQPVQDKSAIGRNTIGGRPAHDVADIVGMNGQNLHTARTTLGWSDCGHDSFRPGLVVDPFAGSGTTLAVATGHGYDAIGIDIDERNADLARARCGMFLEIEDLRTEAS